MPSKVDAPGLRLLRRLSGEWSRNGSRPGPCPSRQSGVAGLDGQRLRDAWTDTSSITTLLVLTAPSSTTSIGVEEVADATPAGAQLVVTGVPVEKGQEVCAVVIPLCSVDADELVTRSFEQP